MGQYMTTTECPRTVLVTGGRGFIGSYLVKKLVREGLKVVSLDLVPAWDENEPLLTEVEVDLRDTGELRKVFEAYTFDCIYDLASFTEVGLSYGSYRRNVDATESIISVLADYPDCKYIFYSTQFVHRRPGLLPATDEEYHPIEPYGASKVESEKVIRSRLPLSQFLILRPTYIWGAGLERFKAGLIKNLLKRRMLISSDPKLRRSYGYVETVAEQTFKFSCLCFADLPHKVYYITDAPIAMKDFCDELLKALNGGAYRQVPTPVLRLMGAAGELMSRLGLPAPIRAVQARELTTDFPVPYERTLDITKSVTDYQTAMRDVAIWAKAD